MPMRADSGDQDELDDACPIRFLLCHYATAVAQAAFRYAERNFQRRQQQQGRDFEICSTSGVGAAL